MVPRDDFYLGSYLRPGMKEGSDFKVVDEEVWHRLYNQYGGQELIRHSTAVPTEDQTRPDFTVEL